MISAAPAVAQALRLSAIAPGRGPDVSALIISVVDSSANRRMNWVADGFRNAGNSKVPVKFTEPRQPFAFPLRPIFQFRCAIIFCGLAEIRGLFPRILISVPAP